jgi:hypothetical protein
MQKAWCAFMAQTEHHFPWKLVVGVGGGIVTGVAAAAAGSEIKPLGDFLTSSEKHQSQNHRPKRINPAIPHEKLIPGQRVHIRAYGHSMLHVDGKEAAPGTEKERSVDFHLASILQDLFPHLTITHDNSAVVGSLSTDLLEKICADREELINFPGIMINIVYTGENDWKDVLTGERSMRRLEGLSQLSGDMPRGEFIKEAAVNGVPIAHAHKEVKRKLTRTKHAIFEEYRKINGERRKKGYEPIYIAALESVDFSKAEAITMYPPEGVTDIKPTVFPLHTEYARRGARIVSEANTRATQVAVRRHRRSVPATLVKISGEDGNGVERFFGFDQHVGEGGQEFMAEQIVYAMQLIPESAITELAIDDVA